MYGTVQRLDPERTHLTDGATDRGPAVLKPDSIGVSPDAAERGPPGSTYVPIWAGTSGRSMVCRQLLRPCVRADLAAVVSAIQSGGARSNSGLVCRPVSFAATGSPCAGHRRRGLPVSRLPSIWAHLWRDRVWAGLRLLVSVGLRFPGGGEASDR